MEKTKTYSRCRFSGKVIATALESYAKLLPEGEKLDFTVLKTSLPNGDTWKHDSIDEFFADYPESTRAVIAHISNASFSLYYTGEYGEVETEVSVKAPDRKSIAQVFSFFEDAQEKSFVPPPPKPPKPKFSPRIFIGHGRSTQWRDLKDHLHDKHGYTIQAYETAARAGHTIRDILSDLTTTTDLAILVLTAEDEGAEGQLRARQNVVHETGLFQGALGFNRAIVLLEEGAEEFSNLYGIQQIRFGKDNIKETFGEVLATIRREFHLER